MPDSKGTVPFESKRVRLNALLSRQEPDSAIAEHWDEVTDEEYEFDEEWYEYEEDDQEDYD